MLYKNALLLLTAFVFSFSHADSLSAKSIGDYIDDIPGIGLIADKVNFDGITLKNLYFVRNVQGDTKDIIADKYVITKPGNQFLVSVDYELDGKVLDNLELHHFIYGLHPKGPQNCFLHSLGITDSKGTAEFVLEVPEEKGVYQLRFCHATGYAVFETNKEEWWRSNSANAKTIMGIVVVH